MTKIINFCKIVCTIKLFGGANSRVPENDFFGEIIKGQLQGEGSPTKSAYRNHVEMCKELGLVRKENGDLVLAELGLEYYDAIPSTENGKKLVDRKTDELKGKLIEIVIAKSELIQREIGKGTIDEYVDNGETRFLISDQGIEKIDKNFLGLLTDLGLITIRNNEREIDGKVASRSPSIRTRRQTEEELWSVLDKQRKNGREAEMQTVAYEKKRLMDLGVKQDISNRVERVSEHNTRAGFDVVSFNGKNISAKYDRFIEVKATTTNYPIFYWSENERAVAKEKGDEYFIYIYINFGTEAQRLVTPIQNPYREIVEKNYEHVRPITTWRIVWNEKI